MKIAPVIAAGRLGIREADIPKPGPREALLRVDRVGICGSDLHYLPHAPVGGVIGHEFSGTLVEIGVEVTRLAVGQRVCSLPCIGCGVCEACRAADPLRCAKVRRHGLAGEAGLGAFSQYVIVGEQECVVLPDSIDAARGALVEPLAVGLHVVERAKIGVGEHVLVLGAGPIGLAVALWARELGAGDILVSDPLASRRALALQLGATAVVDPSAEDVAAVCRRDFGGLPEIVIECVGRPGRFDLATGLVGRGGRVILAGMLLEPETLTSMTPFVKGITVEFVIQYALRHFQHTVRLMEQGRIDPTPMISEEISLDALPAMMERLRQPGALCKVLVAPNETL